MHSLLLMMAAVGAHAQFEKGTTYLSASTTGLGLSYSSSEKLNFGMEFNGGYFLQKAWMLYGTLGYDHTRYTDHFRIGAGELGYRFFGLVLLAASITSIIGCAYTSISFLKTFSKKIADNENKFIVAFIVISTIVMAFLGQPAALLVLAGALNGLILPITLGVCLIAAKKKSIMGEDYKHPAWLLILGIVVVIASAYLGVTSLGSLGQLFA